MANLINTKWIFNENPVVTTIAGYNINFTDGTATYNRLTIEDGGDGHNELKYYDINDMAFSAYQNPTGWVDTAFKTITITGGADVKNEELYAFLSANATQEMLTKNIVLNKDNIDLFPRTKASLLVEDDGKTPWSGSSKIIDLDLTPTSQSTGTIPQEQYDYIKNNPDCIVKLDGSKLQFQGVFYGRVQVYIKDDIYGDAINVTLITQPGASGTAITFASLTLLQDLTVEISMKDFDDFVSATKVQEMIDASIGQALTKEY